MMGSSINVFVCTTATQSTHCQLIDVRLPVGINARPFCVCYSLRYLPCPPLLPNICTRIWGGRVQSVHCIGEATRSGTMHHCCSQSSILVSLSNDNCNWPKWGYSVHSSAEESFIIRKQHREEEDVERDDTATIQQWIALSILCPFSPKIDYGDTAIDSLYCD